MQCLDECPVNFNDIKCERKKWKLLWWNIDLADWVRTLISYCEISHIQSASVRILLETIWVCTWKSLSVYLQSVWNQILDPLLIFFLLSLYEDLKKPRLRSPPGDLCIRIFITLFSQSEHALLTTFRESKNQNIMGAFTILPLVTLGMFNYHS
jgi:hypothetical protein